MELVPLALAGLLALALAPSVIDSLARAGVVRENYRGAIVPAAGGIVIMAAAMVALAPLSLLDELADWDVLRSGVGPIVLYALGVAALGLVDDLLGGGAPAGAPRSDEAPRGWRGHAGAALRGRFSTGLLKAVGALGLALFVLSGQGLDAGNYLLSVAVLVLATNLFNLLDLRPGRAIKAFIALGVVLMLVEWSIVPLEILGLFVGPIVALAWFDLKERVILGDAGSNLVGALAGFWIIFSFGTAGEAIALAGLLFITVYGEFRSISALVDRNPLLRRLDSIGRLRTPDHSHVGHMEGRARTGTDG